jgi:hypothetical protein
VILVRAWIRQALGACGAAVLVPAAMVGVLVLLTLSGGLGRIGNIGQAFSGPRLPVAVAPSPSSAAKGAPRSLAALGSGAPRVAGSAPAGTPGHRGPGGRAAPHPGPSGGSGEQGGSGGPGRGSGGSGGAPGGTPPGGSSGGPSTGPADPSPSHRPSPGPSLVSRVTAAAASTAGQLPGPLGPAAAHTVETVGSAAGALVPSVPVPAPRQEGAQLGVQPPAQAGSLASTG